jgi:hypothetical protein
MLQVMAVEIMRPGLTTCLEMIEYNGDTQPENKAQT